MIFNNNNFFYYYSNKMEKEETNRNNKKKNIECATLSNVEGKINKLIDLMSTFIQNNPSTSKLSTMFYFKFSKFFSSFLSLYTLS